MTKFFAGLTLGLFIGICVTSYAATIVGNTPTLEGWTVTDGDDAVCTDPQVNFKEKEIECPGDDPRDPIDPRQLDFAAMYDAIVGKGQSRTQMLLYHVTSSENAAAIKRDGFRDTGGMTESGHRGVWLSDRPLDANEGAPYTVIAVDLPLSKADLDQYEWKEEGKGYREWLIPAAVINKYWWPK